MSHAQYMRQIYLEGVTTDSTPAFTVSTGTWDHSLPTLESAAKEKLPPKAFGYIAGSASSESTYGNNLSAFAQWAIVPRMLGGVEVASFDSSVRLFGREFPTPLVISPIGVQEQVDSQSADVATARAATGLGVPFTLSSAGSRSLEEVSRSVAEMQSSSEGEGSEGGGGGELWYQLYWPSDDDVTSSLLSRAKRAGYKVLVVTLDTWILGWRPRDLDAAYNPFLMGQGLAQIWSDPVFIEKYCEGKDPRKMEDREERLQAAVTAISLLNPGISRSWSDLKILRDLWGSGEGDTIVLKGIQSLDDAHRALSAPIDEEARIDGLWISNHGGRQVDGAVASLDTLEPIAALCRSKGKTVIFDSGVRNGADVMKALALGAHAVGIGRPYCYGLALGGQRGVEGVLKALLADFELNAALSGCRDVKDIGRHTLVRNRQRL